MDVVLLPYASSQTYAHDYFNCKRVAFSLMLRRKEILFPLDCLQVWVHVSLSPHHLGHTCCDRQLVCPPLSLIAGVTTMAEEDAHIPS